MDLLDSKLNQSFAGKVVRKDLTKQIKEGANVPVYVLEYLLGMYCATDDEATIKEGIQKVKQILSENYVRPDESEKVKAKIKEKGRFKIIDKVSVKLNEKADRYEGLLSNINLRNVIIDDTYIRKYEKLLSGGIWCILTLEYWFDENSKDSPFKMVELKPIQMPETDISDFIRHRKDFTLEEWINVICRSVGMEPVNLDEKAKWHLVARMIPFVEKNFNICELGPRGTGKSYVYDEISPYSILISGGQSTVANLFYNMSTRTVGLVGMWDVVAFDEVAGINMKDKDGIQIMKGFMANGSFSRGKESINADASMVFIGNINGSVENLVKTSHLLAPFPPDMIDTAFFDRFHHYLPGWEIPKMRPEFFTNAYGFISDYYAECLRELRKHNFSDAISHYFRLGKDLNQRDSIAVKRTVSGLIKLLFPDGKYTKEDLRKCLEYALVGRRRVKEQLKKIGGMEFYDVHFSYVDLEQNEEHFVSVPESGGKSLIPEGDLPAGTVYTIGKNVASGHKGLFRLDIQRMPGNGKISDTGFGGGTTIKEELKEAVNYVRSNLNRITQTAKFNDFEFHLKATDLNGIGNIKGLELAIFLSIVSSIVERPLLPQLAVLGSMSIGGAIIGSDNLAEYLQVSADSGAKKVLIPAVDVIQLGKVPTDLISKFSLLIYSDPIDAGFKAMGLG
ncbi:protease Lon-related BREX system protein BrxL [Runella zeae]|uniref:protease Lon-related BREX system protein BrxL n=1 Tax=Runella zeae TaxID=94255 RepID=UPI00235716EB|nr:protease Lon-related BREX system protein BrxL [Runella zeae]